jgi:dihydrofolate reductase
VEEALRPASSVPEIAVIGGAQIFEELLPQADFLYVTYVHADIDGDTFFPRLDHSDWVERDREELALGPRNAHPLSFVTFCRRCGRSVSVRADRYDYQFQGRRSSSLVIL